MRRPKLTIIEESGNEWTPSIRDLELFLEHTVWKGFVKDTEERLDNRYTELRKRGNTREQDLFIKGEIESLRYAIEMLPDELENLKQDEREESDA